MFTFRIGKLSSWHSLIRFLDHGKTHPKVIVDILKSAGCEQADNSIRRYVKRWRKEGWPTAEELGISLQQEGLKVLEDLKKKMPKPSSTRKIKDSQIKPDPSDLNLMDQIAETGRELLSEESNELPRI